MVGLLQKDICLISSRAKMLVVFLIFAFMMSFSTDDSFIIGYLSMLAAILTTSTISYDEFDNGYAFIMTLPVTRREYVIEKFIFCMVGGFIGWMLSMLIYFISGFFNGRGPEGLPLEEASIFVPIFMLIQLIMIPIMLWLGAEKSRLVIAGLGGGVFAIGALGAKFMPGEIQIPDWIENASFGAVFGIMMVIAIFLTVISCLSSIRIMERKEF